MKDVYTLADLSSWIEPPEAIRLGVLGDPVAHSLSPEMQNAALSEASLALRYARFRIEPNELATALERSAALGFIGVNLTVPHKVAGFTLVDGCDAFAHEVGAINTIRFVDGRMHATNTDGPGFERAIQESFGRDLGELRVLLLGAGGGAGQAVATQCARAGAPGLILVNRNFPKAQALAQRLARPGISAAPWSDDSLGTVLGASDLVVNATPLGLYPGDPSPLPLKLLAAHHLVYDLNYQPTAFLREAQSAGLQTASGRTMLLHQGALAFEFWFDRAAPLEAMREALNF